MKILVICQYYYPEPFRISDICEELVRRGHEVHVVTGYPNYPLGKIYDGYGKGKNIDEVVNGVRIHRCYEIPRKKGVLNRFLNYFSFPISSSRYVVSNKCKAEDGKEFDLVFCNQLSPVMMGKAAIKYKKKYNVSSIMYCLDLWPESLVAGGIGRDSLIYKVFMSISKKIYSQMDKILVTSQSFIEYFKDIHNIENTFYLPQYAENIFTVNACHKDADNYIDLMFAGNIGKAQCVDIIIEAAKELETYSNLRFHIVGDGIELDNIKNKAKDLKNVIFYGRKKLEDMPEYYSKADAMIVTMEKDPVISLTLPGKVQSYMAAGKPIIGAIDGETQNIIQEAKCGYCCQAENVEDFVKVIKKLLTNTDFNELGRNASSYYKKHYEKEQFFKKLEIHLYEEKHD